MDPNLFNESGLVEGEHVFNYFQNPTVNKDQWLNFNRNANDYHDIANQENVDYYGALSKLAGINNSKLDTVGALIDPTTGQLNRAAQFKSGEGSLRSDLDRVQQDFIKKALATNISATGTDAGTRSLLGGGSDAGVTLSQNLGKYLGLDKLPLAGSTTGQIDPSQLGSYNVDRMSIPGLVGNTASIANPIGQAGYAARQILGDSNPLGQMGGAAFSATGNILGGIGSALGLTGSGGSTIAAAARARQSLLNDLTNNLQAQGYNNYMTKFGNRSTSDLAYRNLANETDRLSLRNDTGYYHGRPVNEGQQSAVEGNINASQAQILEDMRNRLGLPRVNTNDISINDIQG
jgi:hypothetical protein